MLDGPFPAGGLVRGVSDGKLFQNGDAAGREAAFTLARAAGAGVARISADWRSVAPVVVPPGFTPRDPASPGYDFSHLDAAVRGAAAVGLAPLLVVSHAPAFAEAPDRWPYAYPGSWAPDPAALEAFAAALATRYDGSYPDPAERGRALPRVRLWQAWNEPNLARYLEPQWVAWGERWSAFSPLLYRQLLDGFYRGVKSVAPGDVVAAAGVAPERRPRRGRPDGADPLSARDALPRARPPRHTAARARLRGRRSPRRARLPSALRRRPEPPRRLGSRCLRCGRREGQRPGARRRAAGHRRAGGCQAAVGHRAELGKLTPGAAWRTARAAGALALAGAAPAVVGGGRPRRLAVPGRSLSGSHRRRSRRKARLLSAPGGSLLAGTRRRSGAGAAKGLRGRVPLSV